ncbi:MAG: hypothetical protein ACR2OE_16935 [Thermomicrobiales bacterium]
MSAAEPIAFSRNDIMPSLDLNLVQADFADLFTSGQSRELMYLSHDGTIETAIINDAAEGRRMVESRDHDGIAGWYVGVNSLDMPTASWSWRRPNGRDVPSLSMLYLDFDINYPDDGPKRAATASELATAEHCRDRIHSQLVTNFGFPVTPARVGTSGNGTSLIWRLPDLPPTPANRQLIARVVRVVKRMVDGEFPAITFDTGAGSDVVRVRRISGTVNRRNPSPNAAHPWRLCQLVVESDTEPIPVDMLMDLAAQAPQEAPSSSARTGEITITNEERDALVRALAPAWRDGQRHNAGVAASGFLWHLGASLPQAKTIITRLAKDDDQPDDRTKALEDTYTRAAEGANVAWFDALKDMLTELQFRRLRHLKRTIHAAHGATLGKQRRDDDEPTEEDGPVLRPAIDAGNQDLEIASAQGWAAIQRSNDPPRLFRFGGVPVRVEGSEDGDVPVAQTLTEDRFGHELARSAFWFKITQKGEEKPASPPSRVIRDMLAAPSYPLPALLAIVQAPIFAADGSLQTEPGYHDAGRSFYAPAPDFIVPPVPEHPNDQDVEHAKSLIVDDLLGEFPFISKAELANTVALFLDPYIRNLIDGPTPLRLIEAPTPGSGKGLLADVILRAAIGRHVNIMPAANDDDEWRKRVTAQLSQLPIAILIDNLTSALDSGALASALTTTWWNDRRLGSNEMIRVPIRCVWLATANNPSMSTELARRTVRIRLDPKVDRPWQRTGFRHEDLRGWADDHRPQIVCAALTLIQAWIQAGRPMGAIRLGSFEQWAAVHGGILATIGIDGFLGNLEEFYEASDVEGAIWRQFIDLWFDRFNESEVGVADLFKVAEGVEGFDFGKGSERAQRITFGRKLGQQRDRVIGDCRVVQTRTVQRVKRWRLIKSRPGGNPFDAFHGNPNHQAGDDPWTR